MDDPGQGPRRFEARKKPPEASSLIMTPSLFALIHSVNSEGRKFFLGEK